MTTYLIRRSLQMMIVLLFSAMVTYALLNLAPGGPLQGLRQQAQSSTRQITEEDIARIRARFELDLSLPFRFSRWLAGWPSGPVVIGGQELFSNLIVGCRKPVEEIVVDSRGRESLQVIGCNEYVTMKNLEGRRVSRGIILGDFGLSWGILRDRPISDLLWSRIPRTIQLIGISTLISLLIGVPIGVYSAVRQYSRFDYAATTFAFIGSSMPTFFFGLILILIFAITLKRAGWIYLPPGDAVGVRNYTMPLLGVIKAGSFIDQIFHMIMPTAVLVFFNVAGWSRFVRSSMLEVLRQDYVRTARAKGLLENAVIMKHAFRNALIPFVTILVFALPGSFGGAIITETVFNWPGMGRLFFDSLGRSDYPVSMAILMITAFLTVVATLLGDVLYTIVDPRIRFS
ncbi:MAG: ABC transporter permease [Chloroflexota bacterium]